MAPVKTFDGYIFDYGGVLVHQQAETELARMAELAGIALEPFAELYWAKRLDYDRGDLSGAGILGFHRADAREDADTGGDRRADGNRQCKLDELRRADVAMDRRITQRRKAGRHAFQHADRYGYGSKERARTGCSVSTRSRCLMKCVR